MTRSEFAMRHLDDMDTDAASGAGGPPLPTGAVTFVLTDIEGSTRLWEQGADVATAAVTRHYELLDAAITLHGGVRPVEQGEGDSVVAAFASPSAAVAAALDVQRAFADDEWPGGSELRVRIAVHTGEAELRDEKNYFGSAIIRCARLRGIAHGGQTLLSQATRDLVADRLPADAALRDLGSHRLKDLGRPERVWQLSHPDVADDFPPVRSLNALPNNLPTQLSTFVGREDELAGLADAMQQSRLITLTGSGGCGKTRLALQAAADLAHHHDGGIWWVELAAVSRPELVASAVATAMGLRDEHGRPIEETLVEQLGGLDVLVVLDNCEQVLTSAATLVEQLLSRLPRLRVLATSREPLGIGSETSWRVPSLEGPAAMQLFIDRAQRGRPTFAPDGDDVAVIGEICERLDGIPLAIELAAARTRMMSLVRIASALDDRFRLLTGGSKTAMPRQQTLEASVAWSFALLDEAERALLLRLSVFAGGFTLEAAEAVGSSDLIDPYAVLDLLGRLVDKSLVQTDHGQADTRFRLLKTIQQYMSERLVEWGGSDAARERHAGYFLRVVEEAEQHFVGPDGPSWLGRLELDHDNLCSALEWTAGADEPDLLLRMVTALTLFWELQGHLGSGGRWFARALSAVPDNAVTPLHARALWGAAHVAVYGDDFETALRRAPEALAMAADASDDMARARALNTIGYLQIQSEPREARAALVESVALGERIGDEWAVADGLKMLTVAWIVEGDHDQARTALEDLLRAANRLGNEFFIAWYHAGSGYVALREGDLDTARRHLEVSVEHCDRVGDPATRGLAMSWLAELEALRGDHAGAYAQLETLLARANASGGGIAVPDALVQSATIAVATGDPGGARQFLEPLIEQTRAYGMPLYQAWAQCLLARALLMEGEVAAARTHVGEAKAAATTIGNPWSTAMANHALALVARATGDQRRAEQLHHEALEVQRSRRLRALVPDTLEALATLASDHESPAEAARLFGAAEALRASLGTVRWPAAVVAYEADVAAARAKLPADDFDAAWEQGRLLSLDEAVDYASRARGERKRPSVGWDSLTPTELRVVDLVAEGLTNPQIAERLFIARGTVKVHLGHIFTKLGLTSRSALAAEAARRGLDGVRQR